MSVPHRLVYPFIPPFHPVFPDPSTGVSWCPDCERAIPAVDSAKGDVGSFHREPPLLLKVDLYLLSTSGTRVFECSNVE